MPTVPVYEQQLRDTRIQDLSGGPGVSESGLSGLSGVLSEAGKITNAVAHKEIDEADRIAVTTAETQLSTWTNEVLFNPETGAYTKKGKNAFGLPNQVIPEYEKQADQIAGTLVRPRQQQAFERIRAARLLELQEGLNRYEIGERGQYYDSESQAAISDSIKSAGNLYNDPRKIQFELKRQEGVITDQAKRHGWSDEQKTELIKDSRSKTHVEVIDRMLSLKQKAMARTYYEVAKHQIYGDDATRIERALQTDEENTKTMLRYELRDVEAAARSGLPVEGVSSRDTWVAAFGELEGPLLYQRAKGFEHLSHDVTKLHSLPADQLVQSVVDQSPTELTGAADAAERASIIGTSVNQILQAREKDPAAYLIGSNKLVSDAWEKLGDGEPDDYMRLIDSEKGRLQISNAKILPDVYADQLVNEITNPKSNENLYVAVNREHDRWGTYWPKILQQLSSKLPDTVMVIASGIPPDAGIALSSMAGLKSNELSALIPPGSTWKEFSDGVGDQFEQALRTFPPDTGGTRTRKAIGDSALRLALYYTQHGADMNDAIKLAHKKLFDENYIVTEFRGIPYRTPAGIEPGLIQEGAILALQSYERMNTAGIAVREGSRLSDEDYLNIDNEFVRDNGYWMTNPNETGLRLYVDGAPVPGIEDATWLQLADRANVKRNADRALRDQTRKEINYLNK